MSENLRPVQQDVVGDSPDAAEVREAIANGDTLDDHPTGGRVKDPTRAEVEAHVAKDYINPVVNVLNDRDDDVVTPAEQTAATISGTRPDGTKFSGITGVLKPDIHHLVTKPRMTELRDGQGNPTGRHGKRVETYDYGDLKHQVKEGYWRGHFAGEQHDRDVAEARRRVEAARKQARNLNVRTG